MDFIKELLSLREISEPNEPDEVDAGDMTVDDQVHKQLDDASEEDDLDAQCFGLEMEDGKVVKVYVKQDQAEEFERALSTKLGEEDDIKAALEELEKDFEILKVVWPDEDDENTDDENDDEEDDDGSSAMNGSIDYSDTDNDQLQASANEKLTVGQAFTKKLLELKWSDEEHKSYSSASGNDPDENDDDDEDPDTKHEPSEPKSNSQKGIESHWKVEKDKEGSMTISNDRFSVELDADETLELLNKIVDKKIARFKDEHGKIVYVFTPVGSEYVIKTPQFQGGFRIPKEIIRKMLD